MTISESGEVFMVSYSDTFIIVIHCQLICSVLNHSEIVHTEGKWEQNKRILSVNSMVGRLAFNLPNPTWASLSVSISLGFSTYVI